jgi:hypothetical protein
VSKKTGSTPGEKLELIASSKEIKSSARKQRKRRKKKRGS